MTVWLLTKNCGYVRKVCQQIAIGNLLERCTVNLEDFRFMFHRKLTLDPGAALSRRSISGSTTDSRFGATVCGQGHRHDAERGAWNHFGWREGCVWLIKKLDQMSLRTRLNHQYLFFRQCGSDTVPSKVKIGCHCSRFEGCLRNVS